MKALVIPMPAAPLRLTEADFRALMDRPLIDELQAWCLEHALCAVKLPGALGVKLLVSYPDVFLNADQTLSGAYRRCFRELESAIEECVLREWLDDSGAGDVH